jgi:hypothetical protein
MRAARGNSHGEGMGKIGRKGGKGRRGEFLASDSLILTPHPSLLTQNIANLKVWAVYQGCPIHSIVEWVSF